jgi:hypothetical protein
LDRIVLLNGCKSADSGRSTAADWWIFEIMQQLIGGYYCLTIFAILSRILKRNGVYRNDSVDWLSLKRRLQIGGSWK